MDNTKVIDLTKDLEKGLSEACRIINGGGVVAFPTETVYGLGADALNESAVAKIFEAKGRPQDNPLIVHVAGVEEARNICEFTPMAEVLLRAFWPGPFTAVLKKTALIPYSVTAGLDTVAVRMPDNPYAHALIKRCGCPIAAPSANTSTFPSPTRAEHVYSDLQGKIPLILDGGSCGVGLESTVCDLTGQTPVILRPGGITLEMVRACYPEAQLAGKWLKGGPPPSPGMKYRHYAPRAEVKLFRASEGFAERLHAVLEQDRMEGKKSFILCTRENAKYFSTANTIVLGSTDDIGEVARNLFDALRRADENGADRIYFQALGEDGLGLAVMNRVKKAASPGEI